MKSLLYIFLFVFSGNVLFSQIDDLRKEIDKIITHDTEIDFQKTPGFTIAVIDEDSTFFLEYGSALLEQQKVLTRSTSFEIGSCSKLFTASLIEILVAKNLLSYNDKVNSFLPINKQNPRMEDLTLDDLIMHRSGFPKRPHFFGKKEQIPNDPYAFYTKEDLIDFYTEYVPGESDSYKYAHTNYGLLEYLLEQNFNRSYSSLLQEYIFNPLEMGQSFVDDSELNSLRITQGYDRANRAVQPWRFQSFSGSEGVKSASVDLSNFLKAQMGISNTSLDKILPNTSVVLGETDYNDRIKIGRAWHIIDQGKKFNIVMHTGRSSGNSCFMAFIKETKTGIIVLSNSAYGTQDLGMLILRMVNHNWKRKA